MDNEVITAPTVEDGLLVVERLQDVEPILERAKALHNEGLNTTGMGDKHAAHLPAVIVEAYCNRNRVSFHEFLTNDEHIRAILNDPAMSGFRPWKGRV